MNLDGKINISDEEQAKSKEIILKLWNYYNERIVGQKNLGMSLLISMIANGHVLLESVPGLAKTTAAKVLTDAVNRKIFENTMYTRLITKRYYRNANF